MNVQIENPLDFSVFDFASQSPTQTALLGQALGHRLKRGHVLLLFGDLGSGKTAFTQGLARGLSVPAEYAVTSPTYTLINEYPGRRRLYHVDLYRLPSPIDPDEIGLLDLFDGSDIVAVEWSEHLDPSDRPRNRLDLYFTITGDTSRSIQIFAYGLDSLDLLSDLDV